MTTISFQKVPGVTTGRRPGLFQRFAAWLTEPGIHELDARTLADIGASQTLRAQAELREAWRHGFGPDRWHGL
jgi:hypothetical protein